MKFCDLHTHSTYSDGTYTPAELIDRAQRIGLGAIALTDHNTVAGLPEFIRAAQESSVEAVPGIEFSTEFEDKELHIVALYVKPESFADVTALLAEAQQRKDESNRDLVRKLTCAGYPLDYDAMREACPNGSINRANIAGELVRKGMMPSVKEAFRQLLSVQCGYYQPPKRMSAAQCITFIRAIGAISVLAHPLLTMEPEQTRRFLQQAAPLGLDAMEIAYSTYDPPTAQTAADLAAEFHLKASGGSDFHGLNKPDISLGTGKGQLRVPMEWLEMLKAK